MRHRIALAWLIALASSCLEAPPDASADPDAAIDPLACPGNLVANPSFEEGTIGWQPNNGVVTSVGDAVIGSFAAEMCSDGTGDADGFYSLDDMPQAVTDPRMGESYDLVAWVRAGPQAGPQNVDVVVREFDAEGMPISSASRFSPDGEWRRVTTCLTVQSTDPSSVDVYVASATPTEGNCFQVDAVCLRRR